MTLLYADTSALVRAYLPDEPDHTELRAMLLEGRDAVVTSELAHLEVASAVRAAARTGRIRRWRDLLVQFDVDSGADGPILLLALRPEVILPTAHRLVLEHPLRTIDAVHLAVAIEECPQLVKDGEVAFLTRDADQAAAARRLGFTLR